MTPQEKAAETRRRNKQMRLEQARQEEQSANRKEELLKELAVELNNVADRIGTLTLTIIEYTARVAESARVLADAIPKMTENGSDWQKTADATGDD